MSEAEFHVHTDLSSLLETSPALRLYIRCGNWTARNGCTGTVPFDQLDAIANIAEPHLTADEISAAIDELAEVGLWSRTPDGWRFERGPSDGWDAPLPLWRYSEPLEGTNVGSGMTVFPDPDA